MAGAFPTPSGTISMSDINASKGVSLTATVSFNDASVRFLANQESGSVSMSAMQNKYYTESTGSITYYENASSVGLVRAWTIPGYPFASDFLGGVGVGTFQDWTTYPAITSTTSSFAAYRTQAGDVLYPLSILSTQLRVQTVSPSGTTTTSLPQTQNGYENPELGVGYFEIDVYTEIAGVGTTWFPLESSGVWTYRIASS